MTDPIGTAQERELIERLKAASKGHIQATHQGYYGICREAVDALGRLEERVRLLEGLISEPSIERLAEDIAVACVDCLPHIRVPRHSAMVRLGERLRNPLPNDIDAVRLAANYSGTRSD